MQWLIAVGVGAAAYLLGSVPTGLLLVRVTTGKDLRREHSGRTGGTNAARAAGLWAGVATALGDGLKATLAVWLARALSGSAWLEVAAGLLAILGHNHSIFLAARVDGRLRLGGGAGGAPTVGASIGLWWPSALFTIPAAMVALFGVGYASVATLAMGAMASVVFLWRAAMGLGPWEYIIFGLAAEGLLVLALRPNIQRLIAGNERLVGWRARLQQKRAAGRQAGGADAAGETPADAKSSVQPRAPEAEGNGRPPRA